MKAISHLTQILNFDWQKKQKEVLMNKSKHNKANLRDLIAATGLVILLKLD